MEVDPKALALLPFALRAEISENLCRKDWSPSELEAIRRTCEKAVAQQAKERQAAAGPSSGRGMKHTGSGKISGTARGESRDKVGAFFGVSGRTVEKIAKVVEAAERDPAKFKPLVEEMDRTGKVDGAYRKLQQKQDETRRLAIKPVVGKFRTLVIDPPWDHEGLSIAGRGRPEYAVMSQEELLRLPVPEWADTECHLYLWTTNNFLLRAGELIEPWGFAYKTALTWVKPRIGLGSYFRSTTEHVLFAVKGAVSTRVNDIPTHFEAPLGEHSEKPDEFFAIAERASYPPYLEVFSRRSRDRWSAWGSGVEGAAA
ncbi:MAG: MT-A70 family methyltransferase [Chloroflexota bacterium]